MIKRVRSAYLCDDVRHEDNGKTLLIGVYGRELMVGEKPALLNLNLHMAFDVDAEEGDVQLKIVALTERIQDLHIKAVRGYCTLTAGVTIALTEGRIFNVHIRNADQEEWLECGSWELDFSDDAQAAPPMIAEHINDMAKRLMAEGAILPSKS